MNKLSHQGVFVSVVAWLGCCVANESEKDCPREPVYEHVREQAARYAPLSVRQEYFGLIYVLGGVIHSAVIHGASCPDPSSCGVDTRKAARALPPGARVLGEWHTHPRGGSERLSSEDVSGAYGNRRVRCYAPFYVQPGGAIYAWDASRNTINDAMVSRRRLDASAERRVE